MAFTASFHPRKLGRAVLDRFGAGLLLTAVAVAGSLWAFLHLLDEVQEQETMSFDRRLLLAFRLPGDLGQPIGPRWVQEAARDITALGGFTILSLISIIAVTLLIMHRRRLQALIFGATVITAQVAAEVIKALVARPRPDLVTHHDLVYSASFPSGHSAMAPVVYLTLAAILAAGEPRREVRAVIFVSAVLLVIGVGVSRVYLGVHWPTDVLAGWALGAIIALAAMTALSRTAPRKGPAGEVKPT